MLKAQLQGFFIHMYVKRLESLHNNVNGQEILIRINFSEKFFPYRAKCCTICSLDK